MCTISIIIIIIIIIIMTTTWCPIQLRHYSTMAQTYSYVFTILVGGTWRWRFSPLVTRIPGNCQTLYNSNILKPLRKWVTSDCRLQHFALLVRHKENYTETGWYEFHVWEGTTLFLRFKHKISYLQANISFSFYYMDNKYSW